MYFGGQTYTHTYIHIYIHTYEDKVGTIALFFS
jgi:hypothetical protein